MGIPSTPLGQGRAAQNRVGAVPPKAHTAALHRKDMRATNHRRPRWGNVVLAAAIALGTLGASGSLLGCRVGDANIEHWGTTEHGPDKLVAVLTHDKYELALRQHAALELVRMRPRNGRRIGINRLVDALATLGPDERKHIVDGIVPTLLDEMKKPPPAAQAGQQERADPSIPFKDAVFAMLTYDKSVLVADDELRKRITQDLVDWCVADFDHRLENSSQMFGMEQVMRAIGATAVKPLPPLIKGEDSKYDRIAGLVAELGDQATKEAAAAKLVELAKDVTSQAWVDRTTPQVKAADDASKIQVTPQQLAAQVAQYQDEALTRVFAAMKKVGTRPVVDYCLTIAADKQQNEKRRQAAVAALEGRLDRNSPSEVQRILAIAAADDTPDTVRDLAFARVGEMPREQVVGKLYELFAAKKWKVRAVAAQTVLKMSTPAQIPEFMSKLPPATANGFAVSEPLYYGQTLAAMQPKDGKNARDAVTPFLREGGTAAKLTALGYYYAAGKAADVATIAPLEADRTPTPKVEDQDAKWQCDVPKAPDSKEVVTQPVGTIGDFVKLCVEPQMKSRTDAHPK